MEKALVNWETVMLNRNMKPLAFLSLDPEKCTEQTDCGKLILSL